MTPVPARKGKAVPTSTDTPVPTVTPTPTATRRPTSTSTPTATPTALPARWIPGLTFADLKRLWEARYGMTCSEPVVHGSAGAMDCRYAPQSGSGAPYTCACRARMYPGLSRSRRLLCSSEARTTTWRPGGWRGVAALPYDGSEPDRAVAWLRKNIATGGTANIAGVDFHLYGTSGARDARDHCPRGAVREFCSGRFHAVCRDILAQLHLIRNAASPFHHVPAPGHRCYRRPGASFRRLGYMSDRWSCPVRGPRPG